jgi:molybdopterin-dependent oxidoreductase-like protein
MIPASFDYSSPKTLAEAISLLAKHGSDAKILAGGQSLIPLMKLRRASPKHLIDLNGITDLSYIRESDGHLAIGLFGRAPESHSGGRRFDPDQLHHLSIINMDSAWSPCRLRTASFTFPR